jgi:Fur family transcriptional regulator, zinc uptake regulator
MPVAETKSSTLKRADLARAERACAAAGGRLTAPRRDVLALLLDAEEPLAAYDLLARLQAVRGQTHPPTVYRALEFLEQAGLVHRISSRKAYVVCKSAAHRHRPVFLVCRVCKTATEASLDEASALLQGLAQTSGFECEQIVQEVQGRCRACVEGSKTAA